MTPDLVAEMKERLFTHRVGGRWVAPLSRRMGQGGIVCADARDIARARAALQPGMGALDLPPASLRALRRAEGFADAPDAAPDTPLDLPQGATLVSSADAPLGVILAVLRHLAQTTVLWKPAPGAAMSAHMVMQHWPGAGIAMLQGDHATGKALAPMIWLSPRAPDSPGSVWVPCPAALPVRL